MAQTLKNEQQFVVELLATLQAEKFSPLAWWRFLVRSWQMSCATAAAHPTLVRSWLRLTALIALVTAGVLFATALTEDSVVMLRLLPGLLFCVVWQQSDLFWHLGLNRPSTSTANIIHTDMAPTRGVTTYMFPAVGGEHSRQRRTLHVVTPLVGAMPVNTPIFPTVGLANTLTMLRGLCAGYLLARFVDGLATSPGLALGVFSVGVVTDMLDGQVARRTGTQSKLGQIADGETDFCLYLALTLILIHNGVLPLWVGLLMLVRFIVPLLAALLSYFWLAQPVRFGSTLWGKYAGLAQCLYFFVLLAPPALSTLTSYLNTPLLIVTVVLLLIAPIAQISNNLRAKINNIHR